jgi:hypothetical protein
LLDALILRRAVPLNQERLAMLERYEKEAAPESPAVEKVLYAILAPTFEAARRSPKFAKLMGRLHGEGLMPALVARHFRQTAERFISAMQRSLPDLPQQELFWRVQFMFGAMAQTLLGKHMFLVELSAPSDSREVVDRLVGFLAAGFRAPVTQLARIEETNEKAMGMADVCSAGDGGGRSGTAATVGAEPEAGGGDCHVA